MTERYDKGIDYTGFWDYALGESPFTPEDINDFRSFLEQDFDTMPVDSPRPPEPVVFVADIDDDDIPF